MGPRIADRRGLVDLLIAVQAVPVGKAQEVPVEKVLVVLLIVGPAVLIVVPAVLLIVGLAVLIVAQVDRAVARHRPP